ncbi:MAG: T9SS type A sorting domain-containing protein [Bacteroidota bacterium]
MKYIYSIILISIFNLSLFAQSDGCPGANSITPSASCTNVAYDVLGSFGNSALTQASCAGAGKDDGWFRFTASSTFTTITANAVGNSMVLALYAGTSCTPANGSELTCAAVAAGASGTISYATTNGSTYLIQIHRQSGNNSANVSGNICVWNSPAPPANDNCASPTAFPAIPVDGSCSTLSNQSTTNCTNSNVTPTGSCTSNTGTPDDDIWFSFTATATAHNIAATFISGNTNVVWQVFSGACGASMTSLMCTDNNAGGTVSGLTIGQVYKIRLYTNGAAATTTQTICLSTPPPPPANDNCSGGTAFPAVPTNGTCSTLSNQSTTALATNSNVTPTGACTSTSGTSDDDVWFTFTATATTTNLTATWVAGNTDVYWQVFSGACAGTMTSLLCTDNDAGGAITGLTIGQVYKIRMFSWSSTGYTTQNICLSTPPGPPVNNECAGALNVAVNAGQTCTSQTAGTVESATASGQANSCGGTPDDDVWFTFTATQTSHIVEINNAIGSTNDIMYSVFGGTCASLGASLLCDEIYTQGSGTVTGLTIGNVYRIRVFTWTATTAQNTDFNVCIQTPPPPPTNDNCSGATAVTVNAGITCTSQTAGTIEWSTPSGIALGSCFGTADDDVWYSFVASNTTHYIALNNVVGTTTDLYHSVYSGACGSLGAALICSDPNSSAVTGLTIGNTYYIRIYSWTATSNQNTDFNVCVTTPPPPPANDVCGTPLAFPVVPTNGTCATLSNQSTVSSTNSSITPTGTCTSNSGTPDDDVWFTFVATATTLVLNATYVSGSTDVYWQVFTGANCAGTATVFCSDNDNGGTMTGLTIGTTYRVRMYSYGSGVFTTQNICIQTPPPPPTNDECTAATSLTVSSTATCSSPTAGYITSSTASSQANDCYGTDDDDVWYSFVATGTSQYVGLSSVSGSTTDMMVAVYSGACNSIGSSILCENFYGTAGGSESVSGLVEGNTYRVRVYSYTSTTGQNVNFNICISTPPPPPVNSTCSGVIEFCPETPVTIGAGTEGTAQAGNNYGCLGSQPNPYWYYFTVNQSGNINLDLNAAADIDFALWGPYNNTAAAASACGSYPAPIDCSYSTAGLESIDATGASAGKVYVLLITNYADVAQNISLAFDDASSSGDCNCNIVLPVELTSFTVNKFGKSNYLNWQTASEKNNDYFLVQRSIDGDLWETIKLVKGHGTTDHQKDYQYIDENPLVGLSYYRLKQVDFNGDFIFSEIKSVTRSTFVDHYIYPQPAQKEFKISAEIGKINSIEIIDLVGKKSSVDFKEENNEYVVNIEGLNSGIYIVNMISTFGIMSEKIIIR